eukprot:4492760-Pyramimonas_sp.AAC.3
MEGVFLLMTLNAQSWLLNRMPNCRHPDGGRKLAVAYAIMEFQQQPDGMPVSSYVWDVNNPNTPEMELAPASQICCAVYNPKDPNILVGDVTNHHAPSFRFMLPVVMVASTIATPSCTQATTVL